MNDRQVERSIKGEKLSPSLGYTKNKVFVMINTYFDEVLQNPTTGQKTLTGRSTSLLPPVLIDFELCSLRHRHIRQLLRDKLVRHRWLCEDLATDISMEAKELGSGRNGCALTISVAITYHNVVVMSELPTDEGLFWRAVISRVIVLGEIDYREEQKSLKMETESCAICLDNLSGSVTLMNCSHVFHGPCLLEWLQRKNTCPVCRTELYHRLLIAQL